MGTDKRDIAALFRERLNLLLARSRQSNAAFARAVGIDRSALSQLLDGAAARLPRAETLAAIARAANVSLDWLLGLSQDEATTGELKPSMEIEEGPGGFDRTLLARWHAEAAGTKIRYVPSRIPDLLRTEQLIAFETAETQASEVAQIDFAHYRLDYSRRPETDMEVCMPRQTLEIFAAGIGPWAGLPAADRRDELLHMAGLVDDLYPTFRLFLFDGRAKFSVPYTVFGPVRAAIYVGDMYLVLNTREAIGTLTRHFDTLIKSATVHAHETAGWLRWMADGV
jgi:transcriptional regulator with XRE-family HTH domain